MSRTSRIRISSRWWLLLGVAAVALWWAMGGKPSAPSSSSSASTQASPSAAYRPSWRDHARASSSAPGSSSAAAAAGEAAEGSEDGDEALSPELEARLQAASHVVSVPPPGYMAPRQAELTPELAVSLQRAVATWTSQAQQQLDGCVGRPRAARQPVQLSILFAPSTAGPVPPAAGAATGSAAAPSLTPAYVAVMPEDLRRLWKDTDPDALQMCLDQLRIQPLTLDVEVTARLAPGVAPPSAHESVRVQL